MDNPKDNDKESEDEITQATPEEALVEDEEYEESINEEVKKLKELEDKYLRTYADFENFRKRVAKEKEDLTFFTTQKLLQELLDVKDHLELALSHAKEETESKSLKEGVQLTLKQMDRFLEKFQVKEVPAEGVKFDPNFHEAIQHEESDQQEPGSVVSVYQKGYTLRDRLLRAARVSVAKEKSRIIT